MRDWRSLTPEERRAERDKVPGEFARKQHMDANLAATLDLLKDDQFAQAKAWKVAWGCYLINTPEEIAAHCRRRPTGRTEPAGATAAKCERS